MLLRSAYATLAAITLITALPHAAGQEMELETSFEPDVVELAVGEEVTTELSIDARIDCTPGQPAPEPLDGFLTQFGMSGITIAPANLRDVEWEQALGNAWVVVKRFTFTVTAEASNEATTTAGTGFTKETTFRIMGQSEGDLDGECHPYGYDVPPRDTQLTIHVLGGDADSNDTPALALPALSLLLLVSTSLRRR